MALAGVVGWFILAPQYADNGNVEIPVIRRPQTAVKVQPSEPGGMEILNQDKSVYDIIEKKDNEPVVENLLPPPEQPKLPEIIASAPLPVESTAVNPADNQLHSNDIAPEKRLVLRRFKPSEKTCLRPFPNRPGMRLKPKLWA